MKRWVLLLGALLLLVLVWLAFAVIDDASTPLGACQEVSGSVCSPNAACPDGFESSPLHTCEQNTWQCCVPV